MLDESSGPHSARNLQEQSIILNNYRIYHSHLHPLTLPRPASRISELLCPVYPIEYGIPTNIYTTD